MNQEKTDNENLLTLMSWNGFNAGENWAGKHQFFIDEFASYTNK